MRYDDTSGELSDALYWNVWANQEYTRILEALKVANPDYFFKKHTSTYTFTSDTDEHDLPSDFVSGFVKLIDSANTNRTSPDVEKGDLATGRHGYVITTQQDNATTTKEKILVLGTEYHNNPYDLYYNYRKLELSSGTDIPAFDDIYHHVLVYALIFRYYLYRQDSRADHWAQQYDGGVCNGSRDVDDGYGGLLQQLIMHIEKDKGMFATNFINSVEDGWE